jgi:hypothetical protein
MMRRALPLALLGASLAAAHALRALLGPLDPWLDRLPILCPLRAFTGLKCPTCGLGHALADAWAGDTLAAFAHHPLGPALLACATVAALTYALRPVTLRASLRRGAALASGHPRLSLAALALYAAWGFARNL